MQLSEFPIGHAAALQVCHVAAFLFFVYQQVLGLTACMLQSSQGLLDRCLTQPLMIAGTVVLNDNSHRMQQGENWNALMTDCMVLQSCIEVIKDYNLTKLGDNSSTFIWSGTYLDSYDDAETLAQLPNDVKVCGGVVFIHNTCF